MTWDDIRLEIEESGQEKNRPQHDSIRRAKIAAVEKISGIPLVVYATDFIDTSKPGRSGSILQISAEDKTGFLQALSDIQDGPLDVLLHSPGGSPTATESIVRLLRSRFDPIRFVIPHTAKSAATMLALSGNEILLGEAAELGPIDPQLQFVTDQRPVTVPARAAIDQFARAAHDIGNDPNKMRVWLPILRQYGPAFLQECQNAIDLAETLVATWLHDYMFNGEHDAKERADRISKWLADHNEFKTHSRPVWMEQLLAVEPTIKIRHLRDVSKAFEDAVMAVYWAVDVTFNGTDAVKLIEHQEGSAYIRLMRTAVVGPPNLGPPAPPTPQPVPRNTPSPHRDKFGRRNKRKK